MILEQIMWSVGTEGQVLTSTLRDISGQIVRRQIFTGFGSKRNQPHLKHFSSGLKVAQMYVLFCIMLEIQFHQGRAVAVYWQPDLDEFTTIFPSQYEGKTKWKMRAKIQHLLNCFLGYFEYQSLSVHCFGWSFDSE